MITRGHTLRSVRDEIGQALLIQDLQMTFKRQRPSSSGTTHWRGQRRAKRSALSQVDIV